MNLKFWHGSTNLTTILGNPLPPPFSILLLFVSAPHISCLRWFFEVFILYVDLRFFITISGMDAFWDTKICPAAQLVRLWGSSQDKSGFCQNGDQWSCILNWGLDCTGEFVWFRAKRNWSIIYFKKVSFLSDYTSWLTPVITVLWRKTSFWIWSCTNVQIRSCWFYSAWLSFSLLLSVLWGI